MKTFSYSPRRCLLAWTCVLIPLALQIAAQAQFTYTTNGDNTISITGYTGGGGPVNIPTNINSLPVTCIWDRAFFRTGVTSVTIPDSVINIGDSAFSLCYNLTSVAIPSSVTTIGDGVFDGCYNLTAIGVDTNNPAYTSVDGVLFNKSRTVLVEYPGDSGGSYAIPDSVTTIEASAFEECSLTNITIPDRVTSIGDEAFNDCSSLTGIILPDSLASIGVGAFSATAVTSVAIPNSVTNIGLAAFESCAGLTNVTIGDGVRSIEIYAFADCGQLSSVTIGHGVIDIRGGAFEGCTKLSSVIIPDSVINIQTHETSLWADGAFAGCTDLTAAYFLGNAPSDSTGFSDDILTAYYLPGTAGWAAFTTNTGIPTALWALPYPLVLDGSVGVQGNQFGFTISWATNVSIVVEACTNLGKPVWIALSTNTLTGGSFYLSDPQWTNYPSRFYRLKQQ